MNTSLGEYKYPRLQEVQITQYLSIGTVLGCAASAIPRTLSTPSSALASIREIFPEAIAPKSLPPNLGMRRGAPQFLHSIPMLQRTSSMICLLDKDATRKLMEESTKRKDPASFLSLLTREGIESLFGSFSPRVPGYSLRLRGLDGRNTLYLYAAKCKGHLSH